MTTDHGWKEGSPMQRARRAYEVGRMRGAVARAASLATVAALIGSWWVSPDAWRWAPATFALWAVLWWRGGALLSAGRLGLAAGIVTSLLPLSMLRPCCRPGMDGTLPVCTMPEACVVAGAVVGLPLALWAMQRRPQHRLETALGLLAGALAIGALKCSALFAGEALGLLGGLALGVVLGLAARTLMPVRSLAD